MTNIVSRWFDRFTGSDKIAVLEKKATESATESIRSIKDDIKQLRTLTNELNTKDRQLIRAKKTWETTFDSVPDAIVIINGCGLIELMNRRATEVFESVKIEQPYTEGLLSELGCESTDSVVWKAFTRDAEQSKIVHTPTKTFAVTGTPMAMKDDTWGIVLVCRDVTEMVEQKDLLQSQNERLEKLSDAYLEFTSDPVDNINKLTALCGELLDGACALYNRLQDNGNLCSWGAWNTPPDYEKEDAPEGHICYDIITHSDDSIKVIRDLQNTDYYDTDTNVCKYNLETYIGKAVKFNDEHVGSLCVVFGCDYVPTQIDEQVISVIASAIAIEEKRLHSINKLTKKDEFTRQLAENIPDMIWAKDIDGRYRFVNETLRQNLLGADDIDIRGKTDVFFAERQRRIGRLKGIDGYHTFGEICADSDAITLKEGKPGRFIEDGFIKGEYVCLDVAKAPLTETSGEVVGTVGCGRDVTSEVIAKAELSRKAKLMEGIIEMSRILAATDSWDDAIDDTFAIISKTFGSDRASLFQNETIAGKMYCSCINETQADGNGECALDMQCVCYESEAQVVHEHMLSKHVLCLSAHDLDEETDHIMGTDGTKCAVPVWSRGNWWGFVLLETDDVKQWTFDEQESLSAFGEILGGFIFQREMYHNARSKCKGNTRSIIDEVKGS